MERRIHILNIVITLVIGSLLCQNTLAQDYVPTPVTISKDKVKIDGKVFYSHIVLERQTLYSIKNAYNVSIEEIYHYNPSVEANGLKKNDIIIIPVVEAPVEKHVVVEESDNTIRHTVKWYEDLSSIAAKYKVSVEAIKKANSLKDDKLKHKQVLIIPEADKTVEVVPTSVPAREEEKTAVVEEVIAPAEENVTENKETVELADSIEVEADTTYMQYFADFWGGLQKKDVNATLILPFKATGSTSSKNTMDFYSGVLLAAKELKGNEINLHLNVYDIAVGLGGIDENALMTSDMIIGPISPNDITQVNELISGKLPLISPLDQRAEKLTAKYSNLIQAPSSQYSQFTDIANWIKEDLKEGDKVLVISEKEARQNDAGRVLRTIIENNGISYTPFAYSILEGRDIQETLETAMTYDGVNRVVIASESEAFVNDAVRNLNLIVYNKYPIVLYAPAKIRTFETIEVENFHNTSLHASLTYNIDYDNKNVQDFIRRYRSMFNTEPTQFAFQGYDIAKYFVGLVAKYNEDWTSHLSEEAAEMLQSNFMFKSNGTGYINNGIRRIVYGAEYSIEEVL